MTPHLIKSIALVIGTIGEVPDHAMPILFFGIAGVVLVIVLIKGFSAISDSCL